MPITAVPPFDYPAMAASPGVTSLLIDASGERVAFVLQAPKTGNIRKIWFRLATVTTGQTIRVGFQTLQAADGLPDGVYLQSGTVAVADADDNTNKTVTLAADLAVTVGDTLCVVVEFDSTVGSLNVGCNGTFDSAAAYVLHAQGGVWTKVAARAPLVGLEYADGSFAFVPGALAGMGTSVDYANNTAGADEYGVRFRVPVSIRVVGAGFDGRSGGDLDFVLYDGADSVLASVSLDKDATQSGLTSPIYKRFAASVTLVANTYYRLVVKPTTTTAVRLNYADAFSAAAMDQMGGGQDWHLTKRVDGGAWTDVLTQRPWVSLIVDGVDVGGGVAGARIFTGF